MVIIRKNTLVTAGLCIAVGTIGCDGGDPAAPAGPGVVLEDSFSSTGALVVERDQQGRLSLSMRGRIGVDDQAIGKTAFSNGTLADMHRALHPGSASVPAEVSALSDELRAQQAAAIATLAPEQRRKKDPVTVPKDSNAFYANACASSPPNFTGYTPRYCNYGVGWHSICTFGTIGTGDRSFAWNESPYWGSHTLLNSTEVQRVPPWTFYWREWGGVYDGRWSCFTLDGPANTIGGNIGITWHDFFTDSVGNPVDG